MMEPTLLDWLLKPKEFGSTTTELRSPSMSRLDLWGGKVGLPFWSLIRLPACLAHRLHRLLGGEQHRRLDGFDMARRDSGKDRGRDRGLIRHLRDKHAIVLTKTIVEGHQPPSELLDERAEHVLTVLGILGERRPGLGRVSKMR